jgi:hypothetical protein
MYLRVLLIKHEVNKVHIRLNNPDLSPEEINQLRDDLRKAYIKINEWEKSTFGEIQTYFEDANLKIIEARLNRKKNLLVGVKKIAEAIRIYERVKHLLNERLEIVEEKSDLSSDDSIIRDKELELYNKCSNSLNATIRLKEEIEVAFDHLGENGVEREDLKKISDLTQEYDVNLYDIIVDTFKQDTQTKNALITTLETIDDLFKQYDNWKEMELKVF